MNITLLLMLVSAAGVLAQSTDAGPDEAIAIFRFSSIPGDTQYAGLHREIENKLNDELLSTSFKINLVDDTFSQATDQAGLKQKDYRIIVFGEVNNPRHSLVLKLLDAKTGEGQGKSIPLGSYSMEDLVKIIVLKIRDYIEGAFFGKINIYSVPLGCEVYLNGIKTGVTPREFFLKSGEYTLGINGERLKNFKQKITLHPGQTVDIKATLDFSGYPTAYWMAGSLFFTVLCGVAWGLEYYFHQKYLDLPRFSTQAEFEDSFGIYRTMNYTRISLLNIAAIGWGGTGFCYFTNRAIKKRIFK